MMYVAVATDLDYDRMLMESRDCCEQSEEEPETKRNDVRLNPTSLTRSTTEQ